MKITNTRNLGALTSKPFSFRDRSWELRVVNSFDFHDGFCTPVQYEVRGNNLIKVMPFTDKSSWITDKARFGFDGFKVQRLEVPIKHRRYCGAFRDPSIKGSLFSPLKYRYAYYATRVYVGAALLLQKLVKWPLSLKGIIGGEVPVDIALYVKHVVNQLGSPNLAVDPKVNNSLDFRSEYLFNANLNNHDSLVCLNTNLRIEAPLLNIKIKKLVDSNKLDVYFWGPNVNNNFKSLTLGNSFVSFSKFIEGRHKFSSKFINYKNPLIIVGNSLLYREDFLSFKKLIKNWSTISEKFNITYFNFFASTTGAFDVNFNPGQNNDMKLSGSFPKSWYKVNRKPRWDGRTILYHYINRYKRSKIVYSVGNSHLKFEQRSLLTLSYWRNVFRVTNAFYQGPYAVKNYLDYDVMLPSLANHETSEHIFIDNFGKALDTTQIVANPKGEHITREFWNVFYQHRGEYRYPYIMRHIPYFSYVKHDASENNQFSSSLMRSSYNWSVQSKLYKTSFVYILSSYYFSSNTSLNSAVMQKASKNLLSKVNLNFN